LVEAEVRQLVTYVAAITSSGQIVKPRPSTLGGFVAALPSISGIQVGPHTSLTYTALYRAVTLISSTLGSLPLHLHKSVNIRGRPARELVSSHSVARIIGRTPNREQTPLTWKEYIGVSLCLWGNAYSLIEDDGRGNAFAVHPWPPDRVRMDRDEAGNLRYFVMDGTGREWFFPPERVLHVKLFGDGIVGKSPVQLHREAIGLGLATEAQGAAWFGNSVMPSGLITTPEDMDSEAKSNFIRQIESRHMGPQKGWRIMVADEGYKWQGIGVPPKDAQFIELRIHQVQEIARIFGIPPHMLADNSRATFDNISQQSMEFFRDTMQHYIVRTEQEINKSLLGDTWPGHFVKFETKGLLRADPETQTKVYTAMFGLGALSTNDILELEDRNPIGPDGDKRFVSAQLLPLDHDFEAKAPAPNTDDGPPAEPPMEPETKAALRTLMRDAVGRLVHRELTALRGIIDKADTDDQCDEGLREWCRKHEAVVADILRSTWQVCERLAGVDIVEHVEASRHVEDLRSQSLDILRAKGRAGLRDSVAQWENLRADGLLDQYIEMAGLNGAKGNDN
jgi:HK97 family phage portal protein